jgi:hypothetical protein
LERVLEAFPRVLPRAALSGFDQCRKSPLSKAAHFDASKFEDAYENALKALVRRKAADKPVKAAEPEEKAGNVISLMDAL